jgi:hypothetical protein
MERVCVSDRSRQRFHLDKPLSGDNPMLRQMAAERADVNAVRAYFENEPRLSQWAAAAQIIGVQSADATSHDAVEAANLLDLVVVHSLTLVRNL